MYYVSSIAESRLATFQSFLNNRVQRMQPFHILLLLFIVQMPYEKVA